jgi:hypothetical protein
MKIAGGIRGGHAVAIAGFRQPFWIVGVEVFYHSNASDTRI